MKPFRRHRGKAVVLNRVNVDTDQIIPKQFLKRIEREGIGEFLFFDWRYYSDGDLNEEFELNAEEAQNASILIAGDNFGCGSSREHAVWALLDYGFRVVIAPSIADIFRNNCYQNGVLPLSHGQEKVSALMSAVSSGRKEFEVDLENQVVRVDDIVQSFEIDSFHRRCLLDGLDRISMSLQQEAKIRTYESRRANWLERHLPGDSSRRT